MSEPCVFVGFENDQRHFRPGEILSGHYRVDGVDPAQLDALELSVLWYTEGKGDQDLAVHLFQRFLADHDGRLDGRQAGWFSTQLPPSPLSYDGRIIKIRWCVRVRLFLSGSREIVREEPFRLGDVRPTPATTPPPTTAAREPTTPESTTSSQRARKKRAPGTDGAAESPSRADSTEDSREADFSASRTVEPPTDKS